MLLTWIDDHSLQDAILSGNVNENNHLPDQSNESEADAVPTESKERDFKDQTRASWEEAPKAWTGGGRRFIKLKKMIVMECLYLLKQGQF